MRTCSNCGRSEETTAAFCAHCGTAYAKVEDEPTPEVKVEPALSNQASEPAQTEAKPRKGVPRGVLIGGTIVLVIAVLAAGGLLYKSHSDKVKQQEAVALAKKKKHDAAVAAYKGCQSDLGDLMDSESELDSRLTSGLTFSSYSDKVGDVNVAYGKVDWDSVDPDCLDSGAELEDALNTFNRVATRWNNCIQDFECDVDSLNLSRSWSTASLHVQNAKDALDAINPDSETFSGGDSDSYSGS